MYDFTGHVALVTGASRGIGREVAEELAGFGSRVILASRKLADVEASAQAIRQKGGDATAVQMDVGEPGQVAETLRHILEGFQKIDILVNNAGIARDTLLLRMKDEDWHQVLTTNLHGVYYVTRGVLGGMVRNRYGRIINITSVVAQMGNPGQVNYGAGKAGTIGFTKSLAREVASRNITVNAVAPGLIETDMTAELREKVKEEMLNNIPVGRLGTVEDVALGVLFLASKHAGYITGHVLNINGGMYM